MSTRALVVSVALLVVSSAAHSQPQPVPAPPPRTTTFIPVPSPTITVPAPPPSVEDMLNELERIQAQKAALEKKEQELKAAIRKKLEAQTERLKKLGVAPPPAKEAEPDRVGRIIIEGNTKTPDKKILDKVELFPGQILKYPLLEESRKNLEKAGFRGATVEVVPDEIGSTFKDIRVKVDESKPAPAAAPKEGKQTDPNSVRNVIIERILLEGDPTKEEKILDAIEMPSGSILLYPVGVTDVQKRLALAGFPSATVTIRFDDSDPIMGTLVVKLTEPGPKK